MSKFAENLPRKCDLDSPAVVTIPGVIESTSDVHGSPQPGNLPFVPRFASAPVRLIEKEVPTGVQRVDFELVILERVAVRVDEDLEVVVVKDNRIMFGERAPNMRVLDIGGNVEVLVVPEHLHTRLKARLRLCIAFNVHEVVRPWSRRPRRIIKVPIDLYVAPAPVAVVGFGSCVSGEPGCRNRAE